MIIFSMIFTIKSNIYYLSSSEFTFLAFNSLEGSTVKHILMSENVILGVT